MDLGERTPRWAGIHERTVGVQGHPIHVWHHEGPGGGVPQLLVHGLGGGGYAWLDTMVGLAQLGPVVAPDLPGHGRTPIPAGGSGRVRANVGFVPALAGALGWNRFVLHGNSMGGTIATLVAAARPDLVERLVLASPGLPASRAESARAVQPQAIAAALLALPVPGRAAAVRFLASRSDPEQLIASSAPKVHGDPDRISPQLWQADVDNASAVGEVPWRAKGFVEAASSLVTMVSGGRELREAVATVRCPTLVVWGDHDRLVTSAVVDELERQRPDWSYAILDGVGHCAHMEVPDRYIDTVTGWLDREGLA